MPAEREGWRRSARVYEAATTSTRCARCDGPLEQDVLSVGGLTHRQQSWTGREQPQHGGSVNDLGGICDGSHTLNGIVDAAV